MSMINRPTFHRVSDCQSAVPGSCCTQRTYFDIAPLIPCQSDDMHHFLLLESLPKNPNSNPLRSMAQDG
jgi:hypothetical protein